MSQLRRKLSARHLIMISLGGSLGTGIFLTSGSAIYTAGPGGALIAYILMGIIVHFLMSGLCEMSAHRPVAGSFNQYASDYVGQSFGFAMGYNYWFNWAITIAVELVAASIVMQYWFPHVNPVYWSGAFFAAILILNLFTVRAYGEVEYWLSMLKVAAIIIFIGVAIAVIFGFNHHHHVYGLQNWTLHGSSLHNGFHGFLEVFLLCGFAFQGTELVGISAGETQNPRKNLPRALRQVFWRILLFYILTMAVISFIIPYTDARLLNANSAIALSPFTIILMKTGMHYITTIMNIVILLALLSACNSDMYSATRTLWHLANTRQAPQQLARTNRSSVPIFALLVTASFGLIALLCNSFGSNIMFLWLVNISSLAGFVAWFGIALSHYNFRRQYVREGRDLNDLPYRSRYQAWGSMLCVVVCGIIILGQAYLLFTQHNFNLLSLLSTYIGLIMVLLLWLGHRIYRLKCSRSNSPRQDFLSQEPLSQDSF